MDTEIILVRSSQSRFSILRNLRSLHQPGGFLSDVKTLIRRLTFTLMNVGETFQPISLNPICAKQSPFGQLCHMMFNIYFVLDMFYCAGTCSNFSSIILIQPTPSLYTTGAPHRSNHKALDFAESGRVCSVP